MLCLSILGFHIQSRTLVYIYTICVVFVVEVLVSDLLYLQKAVPSAISKPFIAEVYHSPRKETILDINQPGYICKIKTLLKTSSGYFLYIRTKWNNVNALKHYFVHWLFWTIFINFSLRTNNRTYDVCWQYRFLVSFINSTKTNEIYVIVIFSYKVKRLHC